MQTKTSLINGNNERVFVCLGKNEISFGSLSQQRFSIENRLDLKLDLSFFVRLGSCMFLVFRAISYVL